MRLHHLAAAAALLVPCLALHADTLDYTFTGVNGFFCNTYHIDCDKTFTLEFQIPSNPIVTSYTASTFTTSDFTFIKTTGIPFYSPTNDPITNGSISFGSTGLSNVNPIQAGSPTYLNAGMSSGLPSLFTGPTSSPTLLTGTSNSASAAYYSVTLEGPLTITDITPTNPTSPVPEPSSLALLGTGLLGIVAAARRRLR